ncbi:hypothetical protein LOC68_06205 [Blastopirellula sp. JC732]|uniref:Uncharacterized protein n=1 Tax=Blastopirellula sediminis TaxID=2894196 RepID=A0A9X1MJQ1_9BACT|nr:hypothetical protein [Blastopirellula sediminis]MCC9609242.1 hypothetical protein [Blastopirellula sediminis]MCC9627981.1 hypothetical protein [Blastopirellula sediminis]
MQLSPEQIDRIVRLVVQQVRALEKSSAATTVQLAPSVEISTDGSEVALADRIVTIETLEGKIGGAKSLVVSPQAIVTPAARDALRDRGVKLLRDSEAAKRAKKPVEVLAFNANGVTSWRERGPVGVFIDLTSTVKQAALAAKQDKIVILLTESPEAACCAANRDAEIRAASVDSIDALNRVLPQTAANVIAVDPGKIAREKIAEFIETIHLHQTVAAPAALTQK